MNRFLYFSLLSLIILTASFATFAFASSRTGQPVDGEGMSPISGYVVTNVHYVLAEDPSRLVAVEFDLNDTAIVVKASASSLGNPYFFCQNTSGYHWVCDFDSSLGIPDLSELNVVAIGG